MSSNKKDKDLWSISYSYTQENYDPFVAYKRHTVEKELELLRDIDLWVDIMGDELPEAQALIKKIMNK
jgi:hypothetical protein